MFGFFDKNDTPTFPDELHTIFKRQVATVKKAVSEADAACETYIEPERGEFEEHINNVDRYEHQADTIRTHIEKFAHHNPFRGHAEFVEFAAALDSIADASEDVIDFLDERKPNFIDKETILKLSARSALAYKPFNSVPDAVNQLDYNSVTDVVRRIGNIEENVDRIEKRSMKKLWQSDVKMSRKNMLSHFIEKVVLISDQCEKASYQLRHYLLETKSSH